MTKGVYSSPDNGVKADDNSISCGCTGLGCLLVLLAPFILLALSMLHNWGIIHA